MKAAQIALIAQLVEHLLVTEVRGESPAVHGGDESGNDATIAGIKPSDSVSMGEHNGQKLAVGLGSARTTKATTPFPRGRLRGRGDTADKKRPSLDCACPPWHEGQTGRWHGPCPDAGKPATGGIPAVSPRRTGCTVQADTASERTPNTPHPSRGRRIAHTPGIASPDLVRQARSCQRGCGTGPLSRAGILALQGREDVNPESRTTRLEPVRDRRDDHALAVLRDGISSTALNPAEHCSPVSASEEVGWARFELASQAPRARSIPG